MEPGEAAAAASQLMARAASEVLQLRAHGPSAAAAAGDAAPAGRPIHGDAAAGVPSDQQAAESGQPLSTPDGEVVQLGQLPAPGALPVSRNLDRPWLPPVRTSLAASVGVSATSCAAATGPNTPDVETAAVPTATSVPRQPRRTNSEAGASSDGEPGAGSDAASDTASLAADAATPPCPPASPRCASLADAELSLCATAIYYTER